MVKVVQNHTTLENGIEVVTDSARNFQSVAVSVSFRIGSVHEPDEKSGISHLLEHLVFRGSENRTGEEIQAAFSEFGGYLNAETDEDSTNFVARILKDDLNESLRIIADMVINPRLLDEDIRLEKQIIEQENCRGCYNCTMRDAFYAQAFPNQSIRNPVIGYEDTVEALTQEDLREYHRLAYVGKNLTVAVSGDVDHETVTTAVKAAFRDIPEGQAAGYPQFSYTPGELLLGSSSDRSTIRIGFPLTEFSTRQARAAVLYYDILGGHGQSKLMYELREKRGLVYGVWADEYNCAGQNILFFEVSGEAKHMSEISDVMIQTMIDTAHNLQERDLELAKKRAHSGFMMSLDDVFERCKGLRADIADRGCIYDWQKRYDEYQSMTLEEVGKAGEAILELEPTIIGSGSMRNMPKFDEIRAKLKGKDVAAAKQKQGLFGLLN